MQKRTLNILVVAFVTAVLCCQPVIAALSVYQGSPGLGGPLQADVGANCDQTVATEPKCNRADCLWNHATCTCRLDDTSVACQRAIQVAEAKTIREKAEK